MQDAIAQERILAFHGSRVRTFKDFYTLTVMPYWRKVFPNLVSHNRFVELMPWCMMLLCCFLHTRKGEMMGISLIDSTPIEACLPARAPFHKVFEVLARTIHELLNHWLSFPWRFLLRVGTGIRLGNFYQSGEWIPPYAGMTSSSVTS